MPRKSTAQALVASNYLYTDDQFNGAKVGSEQWFSWLENDNNKTFFFESSRCAFTARRENKQRGGTYWRAYRKVNGKYRRVYLGLSKDLTVEKLAAAAEQLASASR